jgi:glutamyl-tRNA(Gln) amidotransferase subunit E
MIATHGYLQFDFGKLRINKILLEEDSARVIERKKEEVVYSLDRLGIPLIELVAWHDIHDPEDVKKVAKKLGEIFRLTCRVKRGLGSIRQDINISITNGARVEIKGTQDLDLIPEIVKREVVRQLNIIEVKKELKKRKISSFNLEEINITKLLSNCKSKIIQSAIKDNKKVFAFKLENMKGILGFEIQPNRRVGTEIAGVLKKRTKLKGIFHLDELPNYGIEEKDINIIKNKLDLKEKDSFILLVCSNKEIIDAKHVIEKRLNNLINGVCVETRIITPEGNTIYQRPLSNSSRMYPETDHSKIYFTDQLIKKVNSTLPKNIKERKDLYLNKYKLNEQLVKKMVLSRYAVIFEKLVESTNINPTTIAIFLLENLLTLKRDYNLDLDNLDNSKIFDLFSYKHFNKLPKNKLNPIFIEYVNNNNNKTLEETIKDLKVFEDLNKIDTNKIIEDIFEENKEKIKKLKERSMGLLMGRFMAKSKGLVDGKNASKLISKKLKSFLKE